MYMKLLKPFYLVVISWFISAPFADILVLQNGLGGYNGCDDSYIHANNAQANYSSLDSLRVESYCRANGGGFIYYRKRVVIRFNLSSIPQGVEVVSANLSLYAFSNDYSKRDWSTDLYNGINDGNTGIKELYRLISPWDNSIVCWQFPWDKSGGDFDQDAIIDSVRNPAIEMWEDFDVRSPVQEFVYTPSKNFGFIIKFNKHQHAVSYFSSEYWEQEKRPKLTVHTRADTAAPEIHISVPMEGQVLDRGNFFHIKWTSSDNVSVVSRAIYFSPDSNAWSLIDSATGNTGSFRWMTPYISSPNCRIKMYAYDPAGNVGHYMSGVFTIGKPVGINPQRFSIEKLRAYKVVVIDARGREVASFRNEQEIAGRLPNGVYYIKIFSKYNSYVKKVAVIK